MPLARLAPEPDVASSIRKRTTSLARLARRDAAEATAPSASRLEPLAEARCDVQLTVGEPPQHKIEHARGLLSLTLPGGDLAAVLERALDELIERLEKEKARGDDAPSCGVAYAHDRAPSPTAGVPPARAPARHAPWPTQDWAEVRGSCRVFIAERSATAMARERARAGQGERARERKRARARERGTGGPSGFRSGCRDGRPCGHDPA